MVYIELTEKEAKMVADWLQESFNLLEVGGSHRVAATRLIECINEQIDNGGAKDSNDNNNDGYFVITRVHRDDLEEIGFDTTNVSNETMERLASKMSDDYLSQLFWDHLPIFADYLDIPRKEENEEV